MDDSFYFPVLPAKAGEIEAIGRLSPFAEVRTRPTLDIPLPREGVLLGVGGAARKKGIQFVAQAHIPFRVSRAKGPESRSHQGETRMKRMYIALAITAVLSACVTSRKAPSFAVAPVPVVTSERAVLYIYRDYAEPTAWVSQLRIDGSLVASLGQEGFTWVYVQPGTHKVKFGFPALAGMPSVEFDYSFAGGEVSAFHMYGDLTVSMPKYTATTAIQPVKIEEAQKTMSECCRYVPTKSAK